MENNNAEFMCALDGQMFRSSQGSWSKIWTRADGTPRRIRYCVCSMETGRNICPRGRKAIRNHI